jgi:hypothetical protein
MHSAHITEQLTAPHIVSTCFHIRLGWEKLTSWCDMDCVRAGADKELLRGPPVARGARQQRPVATQPDLIEVSGHLVMAKSH